MKVRLKLTGIGLLVLLAAGAVGLYLSSRPMSPTPLNKTSSGLPNDSLSLNPRYLDTALRLAVQAAPPEERRAAQRARNAVDSDLALQYGYALQLASIEPIPKTPKTKAIQERIGNIDKAIKTRQTEVNRLKTLVQRVRGTRRNVLEQQLEVGQAELNLFHEALKNAKNSLNHDGGSMAGRLAKLKAEHLAVSKEHDTFKFPPLPSSTASRSLLARWSRWKTIYAEQSQIRQAQQEAYAAVANLVRRQKTLEN